MAKGTKPMKNKGARQRQLADRKQINDIVKYGGGAIVAMAALTIPWMMFQGGGVEFLSIAEPETLKDALWGPEPWVISCYNASETVQPYLNKAAVKLAKFDIKVGVVDCYSKTSNGKILAKRIGLKRSKYIDGGKKLFFTGNGRKLNEIGANTARTPESITAWATPLAALKIYHPATTAQFVKSCLKKSTCVAIVSDEKLEGYNLQAVKDVAASHRSVSFALVSNKRAELQNTDMPTDGDGPHVQIFFKPEKGEKTEDDKKVNTKALDYTGSFTAAGLSAALDSAKAEGAVAITRAVVLKTKSDPEAAKKKRARKKARDAARKAARKAKADKKPKTKAAKPKARPAPRKKVSIQDEREARRKMDEEMSNMLVDNDAADDSGDSDGGDGDGDGGGASDEAAGDDEEDGDNDDGEEMIMEEMGDDEEEEEQEEEEEIEEEEEEEIEEEEEEE